MKLILASASIGRKELLTQLGIPFEVMVSTVDEDSITDSNHIVTIQKRADAKAHDVAQTITANCSLQTANSLILAADSDVVIEKKIIGKPKDSNDAFRIIKLLSGKTHTLTTALTIIEVRQTISKVIHRSLTQSHVTMRKTTDEEIQTYVNTYDLTRFAGSYALNETPWDLITKIEGSYTNVIGLPFEELLPILKRFKLLTTTSSPVLRFRADTGRF